jgi:hypothetical protein
MKKLTRILAVLVLVAASTIFPSVPAHAAFNKDLLMDDVVFQDSTSMSAATIDSWLNGFGSGCIRPSSGFRTPDPQGWSPSQNKYLFGGNVTAGQAIYDIAQLYHVNPQVILATLQKEQSIITGGAGCYYNSPDPASATSMTDQCGSGTRMCTVACVYSGGCMNIALGYGCPGYCEAKDEGFSMQLTLGTWLLRFGQQRSQGILTGYVGYESGDEYFTYTGPMTAGTRKRSINSSAIPYDGTWTTAAPEGVAVNIGSGATAALYNFTPFTSGNRSFVNNFEGWFGGTVSAWYYSCHDGTNISGSWPGPQVIPMYGGRAPQGQIISLRNGTGSSCIEFHGWTQDLQGWVSHIASNRGAIEPGDTDILAADTNNTGADQLYLVQYRNTSSGNVEIHGWDRSGQKWVSHIATNLPAVDPNNGRVVAGDFNGDGRDEFAYVAYQNTGSGKVEVHVWSADLQGWTSHIATNLAQINPASARVITGGFNGDGKDVFAFVPYQNTGSGRIEIHVWSSNMQNWTAHVATNYPSADPATNIVTPIDLSGGGNKNRFELVQLHNTSSERVEIHVWSPDLQGWTAHIATNQPAF